MQEILRYGIHVRGLVQGVGFRYSAARVAAELGIKGYVRNMPDGSVYLDAEGAAGQLEMFLEWCRKGPRMSIVQSVRTESLPPLNYPDFRIEH